SSANASSSPASVPSSNAWSVAFSTMTGAGMAAAKFKSSIELSVLIRQEGLSLVPQIVNLRRMRKLLPFAFERSVLSSCQLALRFLVKGTAARDDVSKLLAVFWEKVREV